MDKVKKFLEAYVQWLAIALGVGFLGWMVWGYAVQKPVASAVGSTPSVAPGDIDHMVWEGPGQEIESSVHSNVVPQGIGPNKNYPDDVNHIRESVSPAVAMYLAAPFTPIPPALDQGPLQPVVPANQQNKIQQLPTAPPIFDLKVAGGHSNVPAFVPPAANGAAAVAPAGQALPPVDMNWRTVLGTFPTTDLAKAFKDVGITPGTPVSNTCILRVVLQRQERNPDGSWPDDKDFTEVAPLDINQLDPVPPNNAPFNVQTDYIAYAEKNFTVIARPPFYQVLQGDVWYEPGTPNPNDAKAIVDNGFDPAHPENFTGDPNTLLPKEREAYLAAKKEQELKASRNQNNNRSPNQRPGNSGPPGGFPGGGYPGGNGPGGRSGSPAVDDPDRLAADYPNRPMLMPPGFGGAPGYGGGPPYGGQPTPGAQPSDTVVLPTGSFDPSQQAEFKVWAHDTTVQAGKTYRYRLKYIITNPVARTTGLCDQKLSDQFSIESTPSAWTDPVSVESDTNFYAVDIKHGIEFDIFKWKNGIWQMQEVTANPGDMVGSVVTDPATTVKTDFTTGWTLVDIREDPTDNENRVLVLVSDNGTVIKKELKTDAHSPEYRKLWLQANQNKPAVAGVGGNGNP